MANEISYFAGHLVQWNLVRCCRSSMNPHFLFFARCWTGRSNAARLNQVKPLSAFNRCWIIIIGIVSVLSHCHFISNLVRSNVTVLQFCSDLMQISVKFALRKCPNASATRSLFLASAPKWQQYSKNGQRPGMKLVMSIFGFMFWSGGHFMSHSISNHCIYCRRDRRIVCFRLHLLVQILLRI